MVDIFWIYLLKMKIYFQGRFEKLSLLINQTFCLLSNIFFEQIA